MISTANLDLVEMSQAFLAASLAGDPVAMEAALGARPAPEWPDANAATALWTQRATDPAAVPWGPRAIVLRAEGVMVGHAGFHGPPGAENLEAFAPGGVEMGYTIYEAFRRRRFATEACLGLMAWAREQGVSAFVLSIAPGNAASLAVARHLGITQHAGSHDDPDDGHEDIFVLAR